MTSYGGELVAVVRAIAGAEEKAQPFEVSAIYDLQESSQADIVQHLYGGGTVIAVVGSPGAGKTALGIDHGLHVAANEPWFGLKVCGGPVVYFAVEAPASVIMRAKAANAGKFHDRQVPFYVAKGTPELGGDETSLAHTERIIETVRHVESIEGTAVKLVQIDTLASCLGNGDGMIRVVAAAKYVAATIGCAVMLIHHPSKANSQGLRGHGSLAGACDTILTIAAEEISGIRTAILIKSRDSATGLQICYTLEQVNLSNVDSFGDPRTTVLVRRAETRQQRPRPSGKQQLALLAELERRHRSGETAWDEATVRKAGRELDMPRNSPSAALKGLINAGYVTGCQSRLVLRYPPEVPP
jgi:KaiC/GvpD/RAD55 family RecA-like ATPase